MTDRTLFPLPPALGNLTSKQQFILHLLQHNPNGMRAIDIGRHLHAEDGCDYCNPERTCKFAMPNATRILDSLGTNKRELVIRRKSGLWELLPAARPHADPDVDPFPDGF